MNTSQWSKRLPIYVAGLGLSALLVFMLLSSNGSGEVCAGLGLLLAAGALLYLKQMENVTTKSVAQKIRTDYSPEIQPQVFEIYEHLRSKELEGLFLKILDDARGDVEQVKKLAALAESVGWKAFLGNKW